VSLLKEKFPEIQFNIYGNYQPSYKEKLKKFIDENRLEKNVFLHDFVSLEKIREIIRDSDFGVVPYLSDNFMDLALSTKTFEYVAMHLPVITSDIPSIRSIFNDDQVYFFKQGDADDLAELMNNLIINCDGITQKVINASRVYEQISWQNMSKKYVNLVERYSHI
jgi:glycosyltransferase involved in cell wall biosynthesis